MFYDILQNLCASKGTTITGVLKDLELSTSKSAAWKNGSIPNGAILAKLAAYFGVTTDYLLGIEKPTSENGDGLDEVLERLRTRPECRMLFKLADGATPEDVEKAAAIIEALRKVEGK